MDELIRTTAARALGEIRGATAVEPLIQVLDDEVFTLLRCAAVQALGEIGDARAVEPLMKAREDRDSGVRKAAKEALEKLEAKRSQ